MTSRDGAVERLAQLVEEVSGNVVGEAQLPSLEAIGLRRAAERGFGDLERYVGALSQSSLPDEWRQLLPLITVKESYFFRTAEHFRAISSIALPELVRRREATRRLRAWSAGCARGEEPASLAIVLSESSQLTGWDWSILATDVDEDALAEARRGIYRERAIAQAPEHVRRDYFAPADRDFELAPAIRARIDYRTLNLIREPLEVPDPPYDLILLRNVLIYFRQESQRRLANALATLLAPDGFLFLGPSETLWQLTTELRPLDLGDCFCYRRQQAEPTSPTATPATPTRVAERASATSSSTSTRGRPLGRAPAATDRAHSESAAARAAAALAGGDLDGARRAVSALLLAGPADPSAHALEGLVNDLAADGAAALAAYRAALFLDPQLFQVRLLLADCLRRLHAEDRAVVEYRTLLNTVDSGRGRDLAFAADLALPGRESARARAVRALQTIALPSR